MIDKPTGGEPYLEESRNIISQLKEIRHYSKSNVEKLTEFWLYLDEEAGQKQFASRMETLIAQQNSFHDAIEALISDFEMECNRIENEA